MSSCNDAICAIFLAVNLVRFRRIPCRIGVSCMVWAIPVECRPYIVPPNLFHLTAGSVENNSVVVHASDRIFNTAVFGLVAVSHPNAVYGLPFVPFFLVQLLLECLFLRFLLRPFFFKLTAVSSIVCGCIAVWICVSLLHLSHFRFLCCRLSAWH